MTKGQFHRRLKRARRTIARDGYRTANGRWQPETNRLSAGPSQSNRPNNLIGRTK